MRARIHKPDFRIEFDGAPALWNELLRPIFGGPEAPPDPVPATAAPASAAPAVARAAASAPATPVAPAPVVRTFAPPAPASPPPPPAVRTWYPPREARAPAAPAREPVRAAPEDEQGDDVPSWRRRGGPEPEVRVEPSNDPATLYARLGALESRRAEKDAVLAAVWFVGRGEREVHEKEVADHLEAHGGPADLRIRPLFLKHINRTKYFEPGAQPGLVRLSRKGREQIRLLCGA